MAKDWLIYEKRLHSEGTEIIAGIDEAGRGALAGPVVAACVILPPCWIPPGINDSKQLNADQRETCFTSIIEHAISVGIGVVSAIQIDRINILRATHAAMQQAYSEASSKCIPEITLIDGLPVKSFPAKQLAIVKGDTLSATIAAASIVAKVTRDRLMMELHTLYPQYGFNNHKGYGTSQHISALREHGVSDEHRKTFKPVSTLCELVLL